MIEKLKEYLKLDNKKKSGKLVIALGLLGMLIILLSEFITISNTQDNMSEQVENGNLQDILMYKKTLEDELTLLIGQLDGAGQTVVMVTLESGEEIIYAKDETQNTAQNTQTHVMLESGSALTQTVLLPNVAGVAVLCEGGGDIAVVVKITEMLSALFRLPTTYISVEKLNT